MATVRWAEKGAAEIGESLLVTQIGGTVARKRPIYNLAVVFFSYLALAVILVRDGQ